MRLSRQRHALQLGLHAKDDGQQVRKIMRQPAGELGCDFAAAGLLQGGACLGLFGDVHRQDVDAAFGAIGGEGHADPA